MKKIFSLALMATALLISGQVKAATIQVPYGEILTLEQAFAAAQSGDEIQLLDNASLSNTIEIKGGKSYTLNLNGFDIEMTTIPTDGMKKPWMFAIFKGNLNVTGSGKIINSIPQVYQYKTFSAGKWVGTNHPQSSPASNYADLTFVQNHPAATENEKWEAKYQTIAYTSKGAMTYGTEIIVFKMWGSYIAEANVSKLTIGKDVEVVANPGKTAVNIDQLATKSKGFNVPVAKAEEIWQLTTGTTQGCTKLTTENIANYWGKAYGVVVDIYGKVEGQKYGAQISGNLSNMAEESKTYWPQVNIKAGAEVKSQPEESESIGFYAAGQGVSMVEGTVHASTGVYVKGGEVEIHDAYVYSDNSTYSEPEAKGSGVDACGSAVVVDSKSGYAGAQVVKVTGDTKLEGAGGYAIEEIITDTKGNESLVQLVKIEGGVIVGGNEGAMSYENATTDEKKVVIYQGSIEGETTIGGKDTTATTFLPSGENKHVTVVDGVYVISDGVAPTPTTQDINTLAENTDIQYGALSEMNMTLNDSKTFKVIEFLGADTLTIPADVTLKADKIVLSAYSVITIEVGGTVLITGKAGLISNYTENLVIKADENGRGVFAFNPNCQSSRSPKATMEYYTTAGKVGTNEAFWDLVASPFAVLDTVYLAEGGGIAFQGHTSTGWVDYQSRQEFINDNEAFKMFATRPAVVAGTGSVYVFKGQLQGNISGVFKLNKGFNYIGNGYAAGMQAQKMISIIKSRGANVRTLLYTWDPLEGYTLYNENFDVPGGLSSMKAFVLYANSETTIDLDYNELIWKQFVNE